MNQRIRLVLLFPFGLIYGLGAALRRRWFEWRGKRSKPGVHTIVLGNLTVGGTGKTPMAMLVAERLGEEMPVAILSRGYGRRSKGFLEVIPGLDHQTYGDEPLEMKNTQVLHPVYVCEDRLEGIRRIQEVNPAAGAVILDDAWQHLPLQAHKSVLLCDYNRPFYLDWPMPAGNLREFPSASRGTDAIVVTKCPPELNLAEAVTISARLHSYTPKVFFAAYENLVPVNRSGRELPEKTACIVVSALANNQKFAQWADEHYAVIRHFAYRDHHPFTAEEIGHWKQALATGQAKAILTSRKDYMRMAAMAGDLDEQIFVTGTRPKFLFDSEDDFIRVLF